MAILAALSLPAVYSMPDERSVHVAEEADLRLAECFLRVRRDAVKGATP